MTRIMVMSVESLANVKANLSQYIDQVQHQHERVTITRNGRAAAVLISPEDLEALEETLAVLSDTDVMHDLATAQEAYTRGEYTSAEEMGRIIANRTTERQ